MTCCECCVAVVVGLVLATLLPSLKRNDYVLCLIYAEYVMSSHKLQDILYNVSNFAVINQSPFGKGKMQHKTT